MKRVLRRKDGSQSHVVPNNFGIDYSSVIGWFNNSYNLIGWSIHKLNQSEIKEFGSDCFRSLSSKGNTSIIKINFEKGTYAFLDNNAYENGNIAFERFSAYSKLLLD